MSEVQTCGRRMVDAGPWERAENLDRWVPDRWLADPAAVAARHAAEDARYLADRNRLRAARGEPPQTPAEFAKAFIRGDHNDAWLWAPLPVPRTCSFCGGVHPDDAVALVEAGWEVEATDKYYKRYLHPPGYTAWMDAVLSRDVRVGPPGVTLTRLAAAPPDPSPPAKLYVQHFTPEQVGRFNAAVAAGHAALGYPRLAPGT